MKTFIYILILSCCSGYSVASGLSYRGYTVAGELAADYSLQSSVCENVDEPVFTCSGVLLHGVTSSASAQPWVPTDEEEALGGMSFSFLREDVNFNSLNSGYDHGFIVYPSALSPVNSNVLTPLCAFPVSADTQSRNAHGCGPTPEYPDESIPCQEMNITTSSSWYTHYNSVPDNDKKTHQCGFTLTTANDFQQVISSISLVENDAFSAPNEIMLPTWSQSETPTNLPLQAFFYTTTTALSLAQEEQQGYYDTTGAFLPVIHLELPQKPGDTASFIYNESDQVVTDVAAVLTAQYNDTRKFCNHSDMPAYLCSGVQIRATDPGKEKPWEPDSKNISSGGTSFSYLRQDAEFDRFAYSRDNGYILYPTNDRMPGNVIIDVLCAFPIDGATDNRSDSGCGIYSGEGTASEECQYQNIYTATQWYDHYVSGGHSHTYQCGFIVSQDSPLNRGYDVADAFYQNLLGINLILSESFTTPNELRLQTWGGVSDDKLPIQAFFYIQGGLGNAQENQQTYYNDNKIIIPIIKITLPTTENQDVIFTYNPADQIVT